MSDGKSGRSTSLRVIAQEARAIVAPLAREMRGRVRTRLNDIGGAFGREPNHAEPVGLQWRRVLAQGDARDALRQGGSPRVLIAAGYGLSEAKLAFETIMAIALRLRGADPRVMLVDAALTACEFNPEGGWDPEPRSDDARGPRARRAFCDFCRGGIRSAFRYLDVPEVSLRRFMRDGDMQRLTSLVDVVPYANYRAFRYRDVAVGEHAFSSMLRVTLRGTLEDDTQTRELHRRVLLSTMHYVDMLFRLFEEERPERVVEVHGVYLVHGTLAEVARLHSIPVVVWGMPYRSGTVWLSHADSYHRTLVTEPTHIWENDELTAEQANDVNDYLESKRGGGRDYISYHPNPVEDEQKVARELGLDPTRPVVSLFTNVIWDAQIYYDFNAFDNMLDWVWTTIEHFAKRPEVQLVIRVHPAEVKGGMPTKQPILPELVKRFPTLPSNVRVIPPESDISSYTLAEMSRAALIYGTKMGLEIAARGVPVVVAGETFNRGKGFTIDIQSRQEYLELLNRIETLPRNPPEVVDRARRYAHYLFFRRMLDFPLMKVIDAHAGDAQLTFDAIDALRPGRDPVLDLICEGVLRGTPFWAPAVPPLIGAPGAG